MSNSSALLFAGLFLIMLFLVRHEAKRAESTLKLFYLMVAVGLTQLALLMFDCMIEYRQLAVDFWDAVMRDQCLRDAEEMRFNALMFFLFALGFVIFYLSTKWPMKPGETIELSPGWSGER